jgi:hypothetical protein
MEKPAYVLSHRRRMIHIQFFEIWSDKCKSSFKSTIQIMVEGQVYEFGAPVVLQVSESTMNIPSPTKVHPPMQAAWDVHGLRTK